MNMNKEMIKTIAMGVLMVLLIGGIGISFWTTAFPYDEKQHKIHQENKKRADDRKEMYEEIEH
jgi:flagellar basal body-associated protein FliL